MTVQMLFDFAEAPTGSLNLSALWTLAFTLLVIGFLLVAVGRWISSRGVYKAPSSGGFNLNFLRRGRTAPATRVTVPAPASAATQVGIEGGAN